VTHELVEDRFDKEYFKIMNKSLYLDSTIFPSRAIIQGGLTMIRDEIIEEIRERRRKLIRDEFGGSIDKFFDEAARWQKQHPELMVQPNKLLEPV
jgi:hypothetical protein